MHQKPFYLICLLALMALTCPNCKKDKAKEPELPPETTTGAMTFGCKINGKVFVPRDGRGRPGLYVQYVYLGSGPGGGWFLNIPAYNYATDMGVIIQTDSLLLEEGLTYEFKRIKGYPLALHEVTRNGMTEIYGKLDNDSGSLFVKKHDKPNRILACSFSFVGTKISTGEKISITEGRFDIRY
jgi:hypothetical protein